MARRQPIRAFVPRNNVTEVKSNESTDRKSLWTPPPSIETLVGKVDRLEERLDHLETIISGHLDLDVQRQEKGREEVERSREELKEMKQQLDEAVEKLQQREGELQGTQEALDNLKNQTAIDRQKIDALEVEKKKLEQLVHEMEIKLNERVKKIERLEKQLGVMQRSLNSTTNKVVSMEAQMLKMQQQINTIAAGGSPAAAVTASSQHSVRVASPVRHNLTGPVGNGQQEDRGSPSPKHHTDSLGLPPIQLNSPPGGGRVSARGAGGVGGGAKCNFPPKW